MAKYDPRLQEEELKNKVAADWFSGFDTTRIIGKVDFCVAIPATELGLYEAEKFPFLHYCLRFAKSRNGIEGVNVV